MSAEHHSFAFGHLHAAGPAVVWVIVLTFVFLECSFVIGLFLPGDSLLFTAGVVLARHEHLWQSWALSVAAVLVAILGNQVGYFIGQRTGAKLAGRVSSRILTADRMDRASTFLNQRGWWSVVLARWVPWVRTLAPLIAGAAGMKPAKFLTATSVGAVFWVPSLVLAGYYGAGLVGHVHWLKTTMTVVSIAFFVIGTAYGLWRFRQEMNRPIPVPEREPAVVTD